MSRTNAGSTRSGRQASVDRATSTRTRVAQPPFKYNGVRLPAVQTNIKQPPNGTLELTSWAFRPYPGILDIARPLELRERAVVGPTGVLQSQTEVFASVRSSIAGRPTYADAYAIYVFGNERTGEQACTKCIKGYGKFPKCVVLDAFGKSCACCQYQGAPCSLDIARVNKKKRKASAIAETPVEPPQTNAFDPMSMTLGEHATMMQFTSALADIPPTHLRTIAKALSAMADTFESVEDRGKATKAAKIAAARRVVIEDDDEDDYTDDE